MNVTLNPKPNQNHQLNKYYFNRIHSKAAMFCKMQRRVTVRCVLEHQVLQVAPLRVQSLHQLEGVDRVPQEALGVQGGRGGQRVQLLCPTRWGERGWRYMGGKGGRERLREVRVSKMSYK